VHFLPSFCPRELFTQGFFFFASLPPYSVPYPVIEGCPSGVFYSLAASLPDSFTGYLFFFFPFSSSIHPLVLGLGVHLFLPLLK